MAALLAGRTPDPGQVIQAEALFRKEPRLGIARAPERRTVEEGALYQTRHLRPRPGLALEVGLRHPREMPVPEGWVRLGGEGRLGHLAPGKDRALPKAPTPDAATRGLILILLTPARLLEAGRPTWLPPGFMAADRNGVRHWRGEIAGIGLEIHAAVLPRTLREGGWDLAARRPRPVQGLLPAGAAWYLTLAEGESRPLAGAIARLHGRQIGADQNLGRGILACGLWPKEEYPG